MRVARVQSLWVRLGLLLGSIAVLAVFAIGTATFFLDSVSGRGEAVNAAGSLRKQTYQVAFSLTDASPGSAQRFSAAVQEFEARLRQRAIARAVEGAGLARDFESLERRWRGEVLPMAQAIRALVERGDPVPPALFERYRALTDAYVDQVDALTHAIERTLENRISDLLLIQGAALFLVLVLVPGALWVIHTQALLPLNDLLRAARAVERRDFTVRVAHDGGDELGEVGGAFNRMVAELEESYRTLEARVREKTTELEASNRHLEALYAITRVLSEKPPTQETLDEVLGALRGVLGFEQGIVCAAAPEAPRGFPVATIGEVSAEGAICGRLDCASCHSESGRPAAHWMPDGSTIVTIPLREAGRQFGVLPLSLPRGRLLEEWERQLLSAVGQHIGAALANAQRIEDERRLTVLEERGVIARELHDSLAQSLSYLKIQVSRLSASLARADADPREREAIVAELREGLNSAYRQLRELLTTFRLRIEGAGIGGALAATAAEFERRAGIAIRLENELPETALSSSEQIHLLQIVREALANVEHHAHASQAWVRVGLGPGRRVFAVVDDDGRGIGEARDGELHHYGLSIMRDRAAGIGGELEVGPRPGGGTRVRVSFVAQTAFASPSEQSRPAANPVSSDEQPLESVEGRRR